MPGDDLEDRLERLKLESHVENEELNIQRIKAMKKQLRAKYGKNWRSKLGVHGSDSKNAGLMESLANARFGI